MIGAEIERKRKRPEHQRDALGDLARDMGEHQLARRDLMGEARAAGTQQLAVEQQPFVAHGALSLQLL